MTSPPPMAMPSRPEGLPPSDPQPPNPAVHRRPSMPSMADVIASRGAEAPSHEKDQSGAQEADSRPNDREAPRETRERETKEQREQRHAEERTASKPSRSSHYDRKIQELHTQLSES